MPIWVINNNFPFYIIIKRHVQLASFNNEILMNESEQIIVPPAVVCDFIITAMPIIIKYELIDSRNINVTEIKIK